MTFPQVQNYPSFTGLDAARLSSQGILLVSFTDVRDAKAAYDSTRFVFPQWQVTSLKPRVFAKKVNVDHTRVSNCDGQVTLTVRFDGVRPGLLAEPVFNILRNTLNSFGTVKAIHSLANSRGDVRDFRVEYFDTRGAENAARSINNTYSKVSCCAPNITGAHIVQELCLNVELYRPDTDVKPTLPHGWEVLAPLPDSSLELSPTGRSFIPSSRPSTAGLGPVTPHRAGRIHFSHNTHNQVRLDAIDSGEDVRTTVSSSRVLCFSAEKKLQIMLRNIPNKIDRVCSLISPHCHKLT